MIDWFDRVIKYLVEVKTATVHHPRRALQRDCKIKIFHRDWLQDAEGIYSSRFIEVIFSI